MTGQLKGRHDQAIADLREVPRELENRLVTSLAVGAFQARWDAIVTKASAEGADGKAALMIAAKELSIDCVELVREILLAREKATFEAMRK